MRKGALLQNSQSREGGVSARCYRSGAFGFASRPGDSDAAIVAALIADTGSPILRYSAELSGSAESVVCTVRGAGLEGVVAKKRDSLYRGGTRVTTWLKLKLN